MLRILALAGGLLLASLGLANSAPFPSLANDVGVCDPNAPSHCIAPDASGNVPITGTITASLGGFTPSASGARMTPITVTISDSSGTLPTGAVTVVSNTGSNPMYCNVNGIAATTSDQLIASNSWFAFTIPAAITTLHCIATGGSTTANGVGGAGLPTGAGGGSGGGSSSNASVASTGAAVPASATYVGINVGGNLTGWDGAVKQATAANLNATVVGTGTFAVQAAQSGTWTVQPGNTANTTAWLVTGTGGTFPATQSGTWNINNISGTVSLPTGAATAANQATEISSLATIASNTGAAIPAGTAYIGQSSPDPSKGGGTPSSVAINVSTATTTQLVAISGSTKVYVTSFDVIAGGTGNITFVYGTGSNCGTGTTSLTGAYNLTAQAGIAKGNGAAAVLIVPSGNALCVTTSAAVQMSGSVSYQQF